MTKPSCISSEYNVVEPANWAAALMLASYIENLCVLASLIACWWQSILTGTIVKAARNNANMSRIAGQVSLYFRHQTTVNSLNTCPLIVPPLPSRCSDRSALAGSPEIKYSKVLLSKKSSVLFMGNSLIGFLAIKFENCGDHDRDLIAFLQAHSVCQSAGQVHSQAVPPFRHQHKNLPGYTLLQMHIKAAKVLQHTVQR